MFPRRALAVAAPTAASIGGGLADRNVVPDVSLRQEEAECDGNCRGEKLDEPGPQAAFAAQDAGELVAPVMSLPCVLPPGYGMWTVRRSS